MFFVNLLDGDAFCCGGKRLDNVAVTEFACVIIDKY